MRGVARILASMQLHGVGVREAVALVVLAGGLALGVAFCDPAESQNGGGPRATPTPALRTTAEGLSNWRVTFLEGGSDSSSVAGQEEYPALDLAYAAAPYPDLRDDHWSLSATAVFEGEPGRYFLEVKWAGELNISMDGKDLGVSAGPGSEHELRVPFEQGDAATRFTVLLTDTGGTARVSARVLR